MRYLLLLLCGGCATADYTEADYLNNQHTPPAVSKYDKFVRAINDYDQVESNKRMRREFVRALREHSRTNTMEHLLPRH